MRSTFRYLSFAVAAAFAAASTGYHVVHDVVVAAWRFACSAYLEPFVAAFKAEKLELQERPVEKAQACAYATGIAKRERPRVTPGWRMCSST